MGFRQGGRGMVAVFAAALGTTGCVLPLELDLDAWTWGEVRGSGQVVSESWSLPGFDAVSASGPLRVVVERSGRERVTVTAEDNLLPYLEIEVRGGTLHVGPAPGVSLAPSFEIEVRVECDEVVELAASGAVAMVADLGWVPELWTSLSGAAGITAWGEAERQHHTLSGASRLDALDLKGERVEVRVSGASEAWVWARSRLDVDASGASHVRFRGSPVVDARVSATSSVTRY